MKVNIVRLAMGLIMLLITLIYGHQWNTGSWSMNDTQVLSFIILFCTSAIIIALAFEGKHGQE